MFTTSGGGGAGGRTAVHCRFRYQFGGEYHNYGGDGGATHNQTHTGGAGTTYRMENLRELEYRKKKYDPVHNTTFLEVDFMYVHSDNKLKYAPAASVLMANDTYDYEFDEMELTGSSRLLIYHPKVEDRNVTVIAHKFLGDKTGQLHIRSDQHVYVEIVEAVMNITEAPCAFIIDYEGEIIFPEEVHTHGTNSTFAGQITGVHNLYIEAGSLAEFHSTANTALLDEGMAARTRITPEGNFSWDTVHVKKDGTMGFLKINDTVKIETSEMKVKYFGNLYMNHAEIYSAYGWIESQGIFHLNGHGFPAEAGLGAGFTVSGEGYGAGHGGYGGGPVPNATGMPSY